MADEPYILLLNSRQSGELFIMQPGEAPADDRPHLTTAGRNVHWQFRPEIQDWFADQDLAYELGGYRLNDYDFMYQVMFDNENVAMRFKLAWVGV